MGQNPSFGDKPTTYKYRDIDAVLVLAKKMVVYTIEFFNNNVAARFLLVYDTASVPANSNTLVPVAILTAAAGAKDFLSWNNGLLVTDGLVIVNSSTCPVQTKGATDATVIVSADP